MPTILDSFYKYYGIELDNLDKHELLVKFLDYLKEIEIL